MKSLIKIVENTKEGTFHPMFYFESPLPGNREGVTRYKSKMHHTGGFKTIEEAEENCKEDLTARLDSMDYSVTLELEETVLWDGNDIPIDVIIK